MRKAIYLVIVLSFFIISCKEKIVYNLGADYYLCSDVSEVNKYGIHKGASEFPDFVTYPEVKCDIIEINFDSTFIIAEQKPFYEITKGIDYIDVEEEVFRKSNLKYYWIINKKNQENYGPFSYDNFLKKRDELGVSNSLKLRKRPF